MEGQPRQPLVLIRTWAFRGFMLSCVLGLAGSFWFLPRYLKSVKTPGFLAPYVEAAQEFQQKVEDIRQLESQNEKLRIENQALREWNEKGRFQYKIEEAEAESKKIAKQLAREAGSATAKIRDGISYKVPEKLLPIQLYTLANTYFKGGEFEKSALIFTHLSSEVIEDTYRTPPVYLLTGISWYRLQHYEEAERYFNLVLREKEVEENLRYLAQARLWMALCAERRGKSVLAQARLTELLDHHPRSPETAWINGHPPKVHAVEEERSPASIHEHHEEHHEEPAKHKGEVEHGEAHEAHGHH